METNSNNISQELLETVERHLNGTMSSEELNVFETKLNTDSPFKTQVEDIKTLLLGIEAQSLKEQLDDFHKGMGTIPNPEISNPKVRYLNIRRLFAAAAIVIAVGSFWFFNQSPNERLYAKYFTPDPGLPTTMSNSANFEFYDAMVNYKQGDYKTAIQKWEASAEKSDTINYFLGVAHLANKDELKAIPYLKESIESENFPLTNDAYYYLGLAELKEGNTGSAKSYLQKSSLEKSKALLSELLD